MKFFILSLILMSQAVLAWDLHSGWDQDGNESLSLVCSAETACVELCPEGNCLFKVPYCRDCVGSNIYLTNIFQQMGERYQSSGFEVELIEFIDYLARGRYVYLSSRSIYNVVTSFDHPSMRRRFQSLCNYVDPYPLVFFSLNSQRKLGKIEYVVCQNSQGISKIYKGVEAWDIFE